MLNKKEFVSKLAEVSGRTKAESTRIVDDVIKTLEEVVLSGESVQFVGTLTIGVKTVAAKTVVNPATKQPMQIPESKRLYIKTGKTLKEKLNKD